MIGCSGMAVAGHLMSVLAVWVLSQDIGHVPFVVVLGAITMGVFAELLPITIGGIGIRELVYFGVLGTAGFTFTQVVVLSLVWFSVSVLSGAFFSVIAILASPEPETVKRIWAGVRDVD